MKKKNAQLLRSGREYGSSPIKKMYLHEKSPIKETYLHEKRPTKEKSWAASGQPYKKDVFT